MTTASTLPAAFSPFEDLAADLLPHAFSADDGSHDAAHLLRVWKNAAAIAEVEGGDLRMIAAAVLLHDCVSVEKNSPLRAQASRLAAEKASTLLRERGWAEADIEAVAHAILTHSFSANLSPETLEAKILQDADRLDAIGMVGAARCFYIAGRMGSALYDPLDPLAEQRPLDDKAYAIDHFETKLFRLADGFQTEAGQQMALERQAKLRQVLAMMLEEI